ncbi:MAG: ExbD/TolR family protein [Candidatus Binatia bacterium]
MAPLIDCVFLLLTYFLFTISLATIEGLLPSELAMGGEIEEKQLDMKENDREVVIRVVQTGKRVQYFVDDWPAVDFGSVADHLAQVPKDSLVVIDASASVAYENVIRIYNHCLRLKLDEVVFPISGSSGLTGTAPRL